MRGTFVLPSLLATVAFLFLAGAGSERVGAPGALSENRSQTPANRGLAQPLPAPEEMTEIEKEGEGAASSVPLYNLNWYSINNGGATEVAGTHFKLGLSVGQSVAGAVSGTNFRLGIGFWYGAGSFCPLAVFGDVNEDGVVQASDIIWMVNYAFKSGPPPKPCPAAMDVNCSGETSAADIIYAVNFVFKGGPPPCNICSNPAAMVCVLNP